MTKIIKSLCHVYVVVLYQNLEWALGVAVLPLWKSVITPGWSVAFLCIVLKVHKEALRRQSPNTLFEDAPASRIYGRRSIH